MKNLTVHLDDKPIYDIVYEESFDALPRMIKELGYSNRKICVVSESHVASLYLDAILLSIKDACTYTTSFVFPEGEASKNLNVVRDLYTHLIEEKFGSRRIAYMRLVRCLNLPDLHRLAVQKLDNA